MKLPTSDEFRQAADAVDPLVMVIRGHLFIDSVLNSAISEGLFEPHEIEIERFSFPLKLDLAIALGVLRKESRPIFLKLNRLRNEYAHKPDAIINEATAQEIVSSLTKYQRQLVKQFIDEAKRPREFLRIALTVAFFEAKHAAEMALERKLHREVWVEKTEEFLKSSPFPKNEEPTAMDKDFERRIEEKKINLITKKMIKPDS
jgi:hypothetical protein